MVARTKSGAILISSIGLKELHAQSYKFPQFQSFKVREISSVFSSFWGVAFFGVAGRDSAQTRAQGGKVIFELISTESSATYARNGALSGRFFIWAKFTFGGFAIFWKIVKVWQWEFAKKVS